MVIPLFASDQFVNAERVAAVGDGVCLDGGPGAVTVLAPAVAEVLGDPNCREAAQGVAGAMVALPDVSSSVPSWRTSHWARVNRWFFHF